MIDDEMTRTEAEREAFEDRFRPAPEPTMYRDDPWTIAVRAGRFTMECPGDDRCECY